MNKLLRPPVATKLLSVFFNVPLLTYQIFPVSLNDTKL